MALLCVNGPMEPLILESGNLVRKMDRGLFNSQMDPFTRGNSKMTSRMVKAQKFSLMEALTPDSFSSECSTGMENSSKLVINQNTKDTGGKIR